VLRSEPYIKPQTTLYETTTEGSVPEGRKFDVGKRRASLLPAGAVNEVVDVLEFGARKYDENNWQKVPNGRKRYYDAAMRHIDLWWNGEKIDPDSGKHHLACATCCLMFLMWKDWNDVADS
jgi:Domain of unknown function (DUF5664)